MGWGAALEFLMVRLEWSPGRKSNSVAACFDFVQGFRQGFTPAFGRAVCACARLILARLKPYP
jgi:hypothetical protein